MSLDEAASCPVVEEEVSEVVEVADAFCVSPGGGGGGGRLASRKLCSSSPETDPSPSSSSADISCDTRSLDDVDAVEDVSLDDESSWRDRSALRV